MTDPILPPGYTKAANLTVRQLATLLAWQASLINGNILVDDAVEALLPTPKPKHDWQQLKHNPHDNDYTARCRMCGKEVSGLDSTAAFVNARKADAEGCPRG